MATLGNRSAKLDVFEGCARNALRTGFYMFLHVFTCSYMFLHVLGGFYMFWAKKWSPDFGGIFQTCSRIVQSRKNGTCKAVRSEGARLDYCPLVVQARHRELDMPGVPSRKKRKAPASEETLKRQLRRWPKVKNDSISMSSDTSS